MMPLGELAPAVLSIEYVKGCATQAACFEQWHQGLACGRGRGTVSEVDGGLAFRKEHPAESGNGSGHFFEEGIDRVARRHLQRMIRYDVRLRIRRRRGERFIRTSCREQSDREQERYLETTFGCHPDLLCVRVKTIRALGRVRSRPRNRHPGGRVVR